jgi:hypothetical protein
MAWKLGGGGRLSPDPNVWNNIGRYHHTPGPTGTTTDENGNVVDTYQDPITGGEYYNNKVGGYTVPYYSDQSVFGYSFVFEDGKYRFRKKYKDAGVKYITLYDRVFLDVLNSGDVMATADDWYYIGLLSKIANNTSIGAVVTHNALASTRIGSDIAYQLSYSKLFIQGSKFLKPLGYAGLILGTPLDLILAVNGRQSWTTFGLNSTVSISAALIGGWYGLGLAGMYTLGQVGYEKTMSGLEQGVMKPNPNLTRNYVPGLAPTPVIY